MRKACRFGLFTVLCLIVFQSAGQVFCPNNVDFENGNLSNWRLFVGECCPIATPNATAQLLNRHTITSGATLDQYGKFPIVAPGGGIFSLKLGNNGTGKQADRARYYVKVPNDLNNYSLFLRYAVVLQDGGHTAIDQPRFEVKGYDSANNAPLPCVQFDFVASSSLPGFTTSTVNAQVRFKSWSSATINLSGFAGRTIALDFASGDCDLGGHFGYGYIDLNCGLFQISSIVCKGTATSTLSAPPGFQTYTWYDSTLTTLVGTGMVITVPTPALTAKYYVVLSPYAGFGCKDTLTTRISVSNLSLKINPDTIVCSRAGIQLRDTVTVAAAFLPLTYEWTPTEGLSCVKCLNPVANPIKTTRYTLKVEDGTGCSVKDSVNIIAELNISGQPVALSQCRGTRAVFKVKMLIPGPYVYQWYKDTVPIPGETRDSLVFQSIHDSDDANYMVRVSGTCDVVSSTIAKLTVLNVPVFTEQPVGTSQCIRTSYFLKAKVSTNAPVRYQWYKNGKKSIADTFSTIYFASFSPNDSGRYFLVAKGMCDSAISDTVIISVKHVRILAQPISITDCLTRNIIFKANAYSDDSIRYQWQMNGFNILNETNDSLVIQNIGYGDTAKYAVRVSSRCDTGVSVPAQLSIHPPTRITESPQNKMYCHSSTAILRAGASGTGVISYQWYKNGVIMPGRTRDTMMIEPITFADSNNTYTALARSFCDSAWTTQASIGIFPVQDPGLPDSTFLCKHIGYIETTGFVTYLWNTGEMTNRISIPADGYYTVTAIDANSCVNGDGTYVKLRALPELNAGNDTVLCNEVNLKLAATASNYDWVKWLPSTAGTFHSTDLLNTVFDPNDGEEGINTLTLAAQNNCGTTADEFQLELKHRTSSEFVPEDTVVCEGSYPVKLIPLHPGGIFSSFYLTQDDRFDPRQSGLHLTRYTLTENGCSDSSEQLIRVVPMPQSAFIFKSNQLSIDSTVMFVATSRKHERYLWHFGNGDSSTTDTVIYQYPFEGLYRVVLYSINEMCVDSFAKEFTIGGRNRISIPNAFTPDGDGLNDVFIAVYNNQKGGVISIYNRWGQRIYNSTDLTKGWDGTFDGKTCEADVYVYTVDYITNEGQTKQLIGNVSLIK